MDDYSAYHQYLMEQEDYEERQRERDWPEDFKYENGQSQCQCCNCGAMFTGCERRVCCKVCALYPDIPGIPRARYKHH